MFLLFSIILISIGAYAQDNTIFSPGTVEIDQNSGGKSISDIFFSTYPPGGDCDCDFGGNYGCSPLDTCPSNYPICKLSSGDDKCLSISEFNVACPNGLDGSSSVCECDYSFGEQWDKQRCPSNKPTCVDNGNINTGRDMCKVDSVQTCTTDNECVSKLGFNQNMPTTFCLKDEPNQVNKIICSAGQCRVESQTSNICQNLFPSSLLINCNDARETLSTCPFNDDFWFFCSPELNEFIAGKCPSGTLCSDRYGTCKSDGGGGETCEPSCDNNVAIFCRGGIVSRLECGGSTPNCNFDSNSAWCSGEGGGGGGGQVKVPEAIPILEAQDRIQSITLSSSIFQLFQKSYCQTDSQCPTGSTCWSLDKLHQKGFIDNQHYNSYLGAIVGGITSDISNFIRDLFGSWDPNKHVSYCIDEGYCEYLNWAPAIGSVNSCYVGGGIIAILIVLIAK